MREKREQGKRHRYHDAYLRAARNGTRAAHCRPYADKHDYEKDRTSAAAVNGAYAYAERNGIARERNRRHRRDKSAEERCGTLADARLKIQVEISALPACAERSGEAYSKRNEDLEGERRKIAHAVDIQPRIAAEEK